MRLAAFLTLTFFCYGVKGQKQSIQFGKVSHPDFEEFYKKDFTEAEAIVLYDGGKASFVNEEGGFKIMFKRVKRIKILTKGGLEQANINIPFYQEDLYNTENVYDIKAMSHSLTNGIIETNPLLDDDIYVEKINERWRQQKFAIPGAKVGSIIEYSYTFETPFMFNLPDWEFQNKVPTLYSEYEVRVIPFYEYTYLAQGLSRFDYTKSSEGNTTRNFAGVKYKEMIYEFAMKNVPAFTDAEYITSPNDYIMKMDWQLAGIQRTNGAREEIMTTWPLMVESMEKSDNFGKFIKASTKSVEKMLKNDSELKSISSLSELDKAESISKYVKDNYNWNRMRGKYASKSVKDFLKETTGSTGELNLFMVGMLRAYDIEAYPIVLSTRDHGKIKVDYPFESFFNTLAVLINVDGKFFLTEATESSLGFGKLPPEYLNEKGLIVDEEKLGWVDLDITTPSVTHETLNINLNPSSLKVNGKFKKTLTDYDAIRFKRNKQLIQRELDNNYDLHGEISYSNENSATEPYIIEYEASFPLSTFEGNFYLRPFLNKAPTINPFKSEDRTYPVDFNYSQKKQFSASISIPDGYEVTEIPERVNFSNDLVDFSYELLISPAKDNITAMSQYVLKKAVYQPEEYKRLKSFLDQITSTYNQQVKVSKK